MANLKLRAIFEAVDRITAPVRKIIGGVDGLKKSVERITSATRGLRRGFLDGIAAVQLFGEEAAKTQKKNRGLAMSFGWIGTALAGLSGLGLLKGVIDTNSKFEQYQATLETVLGSQQKARAAMAWVQDFAKRTPYELDQVMEGYVRLTAYGIDPQTRAMRSLGNAASAMNKEYMAAVEMLADAKTGEFERLKEFGVRAAQQGDKVKFTYSKAGKEITVVAKKTATNIENALLDIFDTRFEGAMDRQSKTFAGMMSNLKDAYTGFEKAVGDAGFFAFISNDLGKFMSWLSDGKNSTAVAAWAKKVSGALIEFYVSIRELMSSIDWISLIGFLSSAATAIAGFIKTMGGLKGVISLGIAAWIAGTIFGLNALTPAIIAVTAALFGVQLAAWPITLTIAAIAGLAAAAFWIITNWSTVKKWWSAFWSWLFKAWKGMPVWVQLLLSWPLTIIANWEKIKTFFAGLGEWMGKWFVEKPKQWWNSMPSWLKGVLGGAVSVMVPGGSLLGAPMMADALHRKRPAIGPAQQQQPWAGHLGISITGAGQPRVTDLKTSGDGPDLGVGRGFQGAF